MRSSGFKKMRGFTLLEMMVVIGIAVLITVTVLADLPAFRNKTALDLLAQEVAITIRQAQVFGAGTRSYGIAFPSHGVYFKVPINQTAQDFVLFADANDNGQYGLGDGCGGGATECREKFVFHGGVVLSELRGCTSVACGDPPIPELTIVFKRPRTRAVFLEQGYSSVRIVIASLRDLNDKRTIRVWNTGHVYVEPT